MSRRAALGRHRFRETPKIGRSASKSRRRYESSKPLPPREQTVADQNLDRPSDRKSADAEPPSELRFTVDACPGLTPRKILSKPIEELEVERPVEAGLKHSFCHVRPVIRLTGQSAVEKRNVKEPLRPWFEKPQCLGTLARSTQQMEAQGSVGGAERQIAQQLSAFGSVEVPALRFNDVDVQVGNIDVTCAQTLRREVARIWPAAGVGDLIAATMRQRESCVPAADGR